MQRTLRNRVPGAATAIAVVTTLASSALIANAQTTDGGTTGDGGADEVGAQALANTAFPDGQWTADISHGELIRSGNDQNMNIDTCNLQMLYQGRDPNTGGMEYSQLPYHLALLTLKGGASC